MLTTLRRHAAFLRDRLQGLRSEAYTHYPGAPERWRFYLDFAVTFPLCGQSVADYFKYEFAGKPLAERRRFVTALRVNRVLRAFNDPKAARVFRDKAAFHRVFGDLAGRAFFDPAHANVDDLEAFLESYACVVVKPAWGSFGRGVRYLDSGERSNPAMLQDWLRRHHCFMEEAIVQHPTLAALHPASVNTVRIVTVLGNECARVATALIRIGNHGRCVDNFRGGGICAAVDADTGLVTTTAIDAQCIRYERHPVTAIGIRGLQVPAWPQVLDVVRRAAARVPAVRYVGWDVAITSAGRPILVEGNDSANFDVQQMADQVGKWPLYRELMRQH